ncbi:putative SWIM-type domain-containing protein [Seiridium cardinale]|uniref:SWIM-type domain-containing protein n=1 Tax=Seiridium cardinale TaxID=138064 RepID=A0ABR2XBX0_9PEZI
MLPGVSSGRIGDDEVWQQSIIGPIRGGGKALNRSPSPSYNAPSSSMPRSYKQPEYPQGLPRLLRKGKATYAVGTGPLPDDIDWSKIPFAVLKEECGKRDMPTSGTAKVLRESLTNYKEPEDLPPSMDVSRVVGKTKSDSGEKRKRNWVDAPDRVYHNKLDVIKKETTCILGFRESLGELAFGGPSIEFRVASDRTQSSLYRVSISKVPDCDCPSKQWRRSETCKHVYAILVNVLKVPEPFSWQNAFLPEELEGFFDPILKSSPGGEVATCNVGELAAGNCPVCFREMTDPDATVVECGDCHVMIHQRCFNVWTMYKEGYDSLKCIACHSDWAQPGQWGLSGLLADDAAVAQTKTEAKAAKAAEKAAAAEAKAAAKAEREATRAATRTWKEEMKESKKRKRAAEVDEDEDRHD